jgi:TPR repeat protein
MEMKNAIVLSLVFAVLAGCATQRDEADQALAQGDYKTAFADYQALAAKGDFAADDQLAYMYANGKGVPEDLVESQRWFEKSANDGSDFAARTLGDAYLFQAVQPDYANAFKWYKVAADRHDAYSALELSALYENGLGVTRDHDAAVHYLDAFVGQTNVVGQKTAYMYTGGDNTGGFMLAVQEVMVVAARHSPDVKKFNDGAVHLSFHYQAGRALDVAVAKSSGNPQADAVAVALLQDTFLPPVLPSLSRVPNFEITIDFGQPKSQGLYASAPPPAATRASPAASTH